MTLTFDCLWANARTGLGTLILGSSLGFAVGAQERSAPSPTLPTTAPTVAAATTGAQRLFEQTRTSLVQVRVLLKAQASQAEVGSGFFVEPNRIITNYHVVSDYALEPDRYQLIYRLADGREGPLDLIAFDVRHDLAVVQLGPAANATTPPPGNSRSLTSNTPRPQSYSGLAFRPAHDVLSKGEPIYSMGNPLDVGFAVVSGTYNGLVERSYYPSIFFGGSLNAGMSGGPALDSEGHVIGVNVATRRDGQQISFLVPAQFAQDLLLKARLAPVMHASAYPEVTRQLTAHQADMTARLMSQPWRSAGNPDYFIPVPQEDFMRCWGGSSESDAKGLQFQRSDCVMESGIFVNDKTNIVSLNVRSESYDGTNLGPWRFAREYSDSMRNESLASAHNTTTKQCVEHLISPHGLPLRTVLCVSAYKKLTGLFDASVLVAAADHPSRGLLARLDIQGVSFDNALKIAAYYVQGFERLPRPTTASTHPHKP